MSSRAGCAQLRSPPDARRALPGSARPRRAPAALLALLSATLPLASSLHGAEALTPAEVQRILRLARPEAPPPDETSRVADDPRAAALGRRLFEEPRLSFDGSFSCTSCHDPARHFTDGRAVAMGRVERERSTPSLLDVAWQRWLNWDGSADTLWGQALDPIEHPDELAGDRLSVARLIAGDAAYRDAYEAIFGPLPSVDWGALPTRARPWPRQVRRPPSDGGGAAGSAADELDLAWRAIPEPLREIIDTIFVNVGKSIAAFERTLRWPESPFDRFVAALRRGDGDAAAKLSPAALRGARLFIGDANCRLCHNGPLLSDGEFHSVGIPPREGPAPRDPGRFAGAELLVNSPFNAIGRFSDDPTGPRGERVRTLARSPETWGQFRTPSLRGVARTAPYMHAGQFATLHDVVRFYSTLEGQVIAGHHRETVLEPLGLSDAQIDDLVAFLESLGPGSDAAGERSVFPQPERAVPPMGGATSEFP